MPNPGLVLSLVLLTQTSEPLDSNLTDALKERQQEFAMFLRDLKDPTRGPDKKNLTDSLVKYTPPSDGSGTNPTSSANDASSDKVR